MKVAFLYSFRTMRYVHEEPWLNYIYSYLCENGKKVLVLDPNREDFYNDVQHKDIDIYAITTYDCLLDRILNMCNKIKQLAPGSVICLGGFSASYQYEAILSQSDSVDYVICGEGEKPFFELVNSIESHLCVDTIKGIAYKKDGTIIKNSSNTNDFDINIIKSLAHPMLQESNISYAMISSSRGCFRDCSFCGYRNYLKGSSKHIWKGRAVSNVVDEIENIVNAHNIRLFRFADSSYEDPDLSRCKNIADEIIRRKLIISYKVFMRAESISLISDDLFNLLVESGLSSIFIGVESGNNSDLKLYSKYADVNTNLNAIKICASKGLGITFGFINFNPYSNVDTLLENIRFLHETGAAAYLNLISSYLVPYKGTRITEMLVRDSLLSSDNYNDLANVKYLHGEIEMLVSYLKISNGSKWISNCYKLSKYIEDVPNTLRAFERVMDALDIKDEYISTRCRNINDMIEEARIEKNDVYAEWFIHLVNMCKRLAFDFDNARDLYFKPKQDGISLSRISGEYFKLAKYTAQKYATLAKILI